MDLVYVVRSGDSNPLLRYSLRSLALFAPRFDKIYIAGYKPVWLRNTEYIPVKQDTLPVDNVGRSIMAACNSSVSDDFMLMNDDFICTKSIKKWDCRALSKGRLSDYVDYYKNRRQPEYGMAALNTIRVLQSIFLTKQEFDNYDLHLPMCINKQKYIQAITLPIVQDYETQVFFWRSLYGNLTFENPITMEDVKIYNDCLPKTEWISLSHSYITMPLLLSWLKTTFKDKCIYEQ